MTRVLFTFALFGARISLEWKFADLWIGAYYARSKSNAQRWDVWVCLLPCLPIHVEYPRPLTGREFLRALDRSRAEGHGAPLVDAEDVEAFEHVAYVCGCAFCVAVDDDDPEDHVPCLGCGRAACTCNAPCANCGRPWDCDCDAGADEEANHV